MSKKAGYTPNENRSNVKNPNHPAHAANNGNRGGQLNPRHPNYGGTKPHPGKKPGDARK